MDFLDLSGPTFLKLYIGSLIGAVAAALVLRAVLCRVLAGIDGGDAGQVLDPYETAYLAGGEQLAVYAAIAGLTHQSIVSVDGISGTVMKHAAQPAKLHPLEEQVVDSIDATLGMSLNVMHSSRFAALEEIREKLEQLGLTYSNFNALSIRLLSVLPIVAVLGVGLLKIMVGLTRDKPVLFLVGLMIAAGIIIFAFARWKVFRTPAGDRTLSSLQKSNAALQTTSKTNNESLSGQDMAYAVALFGTAVLVGPMFTGFTTALMPPAGGGNSWWSGGSSGCGGSSCGSSCGGGGCGGGGCGGCGG